MLSKELVAEVRRLYYAEHWKVGTIASELGLHHTTVRRALGLPERCGSTQPRATKTQPYEEFIRQTLENHRRLRATRIYDMVRARGYEGGIAQLRRFVRRVRPRGTEVYARVQVFPFGQEIRPSLRSRGTTRIRVDTAVLHELLRLNKATCDRRPIQE